MHRQTDHAHFENLEARQLLSTFTVTSFADSGAGSLRQAILDANAQAGADIVEFDPSMAGQTVSLTSGQITISDSLTLRGTDSGGNHLGVTIDGNQLSRIFDVNDGTSGDIAVTISDIRIRRGSVAPAINTDGGGAIRNAESLTLNRVNLDTNRLTALGLGGAILSSGILTIRDSAVFDNTALGNGGAITTVGRATGASLTIINSSLYNNTATQFGGAIWQNDAGVGNSMTILRNSTVSGNQADSDNAGGESGGGLHMWSTGSLLLTSTIVANNSRAGAAAPDDIILDGGASLNATSANNLVENAATDGGLGGLGNGNITGVDPMLGSAGYIGGTTRSLPLLAGSPAVDMGGNSQSLSTDQRGFSRSSGAGVDIGAFEQQAVSIVVDSSADNGLDGLFGPGQTTLRDALVITNANPGADTITFAGSLAGSTITLIGTQLLIQEDVTIAGPGASSLAVDGAALSRVFLVDDFDYTANMTVGISGLTIQNGAVGFGNYGAGLANEDDLTLTDVVVTGNSLGAGNFDFGAGIYNGNQNLGNNGLTGANLTLVRTTVSNNTNGHGTGIFSAGNLNLTDSTISGNTSEANASGAGVNFQGLTLSISRSTFSGNTTPGNAGEFGGGIFINAAGTATISNSTFIANAAGSDGGGLAAGVSAGTITISGSTFAGNTATTQSGGGIATFGHTVTITNSTISGNTAGGVGGGISDYGATQLNIRNSTIAFNTSAGGGGLFANNVAIALTSTIIANNTNSGGSTPDDIGIGAGSINPLSANNLIGDAATAGGLTDGDNNNIVGHDAMLAALASNGGATQTHALLAGSPAIDAGSASPSLGTDQRGGLFVRSKGGAPDIGAYEKQALALVVDTTEATDDGDTSAGDLSIREALVATNANPEDDQISFDASLSGSTITLFGSSLQISDDVTITGLGADQLTIDGNANSRIFTVTDGSAATIITVTISGLTLTNGSIADGGAIENLENLTLDSLTISGNTATNDGGGIHNTGTMTIIGCTISGNTAADAGGAIDNDGATAVTISNSTITGNTAGGSAGAIDNDAGSTLTISDSSLTLNAAGANGGAIDNAGTLTITSSTISDNMSTDPANGFGGAIINQTGGTLTITGSTLSNNSGVSSGGAIENNGSATITESTLGGNSAADAGGAIDNFGGSLTIVRSTLTGNSTGGSGGAIWTDTALTITSSTISGNSAGGFGGGIGMFDGTVVIDNSTIAFNTADANDDQVGQGGGIDVGKQAGAGTLTTTSTIYANNMLGSAGPVANDITLTNGSVSGSNNLVMDQSTAGGLQNGVNGNLVGVDPLLGDLADNGGPTLTHAIYPGSAAYNAGLASGAVSTDQRGQGRTQGAGPDIGAYEWRPTPNFSLAPLAGSTARTTSTSDNTHIHVIRNADGDLIAYTGGGSVWTAARIRDYINAPAVTGDPIVWTDPADGLVYVAAPSAEGFILHRRAANGTWTFQNLSSLLGVGTSDSPTGVLAMLTTKPKTGDPVVIVAGITNAGEIVAFQQTGATNGGLPVWSFVNISDDLASQQMTTPAFTQMVSYVTSWNQWTLAGLDASGNVQGVWVAVGTFTTWRVDNLSAITGADPLTGQLDVTVTPWGGIRFVGANATGRLVGTWWNPGRGPGNWAQTDMSAAVEGAAPAFVGGTLTAWFTPTNIISYAGYDANGDMLHLHWRPGEEGVWSIDNLTSALSNRNDRPVGTMTAAVSNAGTVTIIGANADQDLVQVFSNDGEDGTFLINNLTDLALRI